MRCEAQQPPAWRLPGACLAPSASMRLPPEGPSQGALSRGSLKKLSQGALSRGSLNWPCRGVAQGVSRCSQMSTTKRAVTSMLMANSGCVNGSGSFSTPTSASICFDADVLEHTTSMKHALTHQMVSHRASVSSFSLSTQRARNTVRKHNEHETRTKWGHETGKQQK